MLLGRYKKIRQFNIPSYISGANLCVEKVIELKLDEDEMKLMQVSRQHVLDVMKVLDNMK